jgi:hypothetical protein
MTSGEALSGGAVKSVATAGSSSLKQARTFVVSGLWFVVCGFWFIWESRIETAN